MKKFFASLFILVSAFYSSSAQVKDIAFAAVKYNFRWVTDTTEPKDITSETMVLYLGKKMSGYRSLDRIIFDSIVKEQMVQNEINFRTGGRIEIGRPGLKSGSSDALFKYNETSKMDRTERVMKTYIIEEEIPTFSWDISQDTKDIQGIACQKATVSFRGRNYTAWFSNTLPYSNGPWKLGGLPGLIIEAYDDKKEVVFEFAGFEDVSSRNIVIELPLNLVRATAKEVKQLQEAMAKDPEGFRRSQMAASGVSVSSVRVVNGAPMAGGGTPVKRKVYNNPIEKTTDK